eukprot:TRINITY_DN7294_c0_g1_i1.p1 TRINITY_DN7294_c0_g1~~TRINITY_DN7294_c0_g1_i1.p1  ORF type:complete len:447 (-),score=53.28 TRINITY_DN7294_c0_g1_i1:582-1922(-)
MAPLPLTPNLIPLMPSLQSLFLDPSNAHLTPTFAYYFTHLRALTLYSSRITLSLLESQPHLTSLCVKRVSITAAMIARQTKLQYLQIDDCDLDRPLPSLPHLRTLSLTRFSLTYNALRTQSIFLQLPDLPSLTQLKVVHTVLRPDILLPLVGLFDLELCGKTAHRYIITQLTNLLSLTLREFQGGIDHSLQALPQLTSLSLSLASSNSSKITDEGLACLTNLRRLILNDSVVTDRSVLLLTGLTELNLSACHFVSESISILTRLKSLTLKHVKQVPNISRLTSLTSLKITNVFTNLSNMPGSRLPSLPLLTELYLESVYLRPSTFPKLQSLRLRGDHVTNSYLMEFSSPSHPPPPSLSPLQSLSLAASRVSSLILSGASPVTNKGIAEAFPFLRYFAFRVRGRQNVNPLTPKIVSLLPHLRVIGTEIGLWKEWKDLVPSHVKFEAI